MFSTGTSLAIGGAKLLWPDQIPLTSPPRQDLLSESLLSLSIRNLNPTCSQVPLCPRYEGCQSPSQIVQPS